MEGKCENCKYRATFRRNLDDFDLLGNELADLRIICECKSSAHYGTDVVDAGVVGCACFAEGTAEIIDV